VGRGNQWVGTPVFRQQWDGHPGELPPVPDGRGIPLGTTLGNLGDRDIHIFTTKAYLVKEGQTFYRASIFFIGFAVVPRPIFTSVRGGR